MIVFGPIAMAHANVVEWTTSYGTRVVFVPAPEIPMVDVAVDIDAGSRWDPPTQAGLASLTLGMLSKGLRAADGQPAMTETEVSEAFAELAVQRSGGTSLDRASLSLRMLSDADIQERAAMLGSRLLHHPQFDPAILDREKARTIAAIEESMTQPQSIATRALWRSIYPSHPYGQSATPESIRSISAQSLAEFHRDYWKPNRMRVTIVGALTEAQARQLVDRMFVYAAKTQASPVSAMSQRGDWSTKTSATRQSIAHPASQSHVWLGLPGIARDDPDFFAMTVGNYILGGGGFVSRLTEEIREKRGLSYSVFSTFQPLAQPGPFLIGLQTQSAKAPEALKVVRTTVERFLKDGPTADEIKAAQQNLVGGFALRVDSNRKLLDNYAQINFYDMPLDYLQTWSSKIAAVTADDVRRVMTRVLQPEQMSVVVVAGPEGFQP